MTALVVDDSKAMRVILARMLAQMGFAVSEARDGKEALERIQAMDSLDLALVDWNMPEMDGFAFIEAVRSDPRWDGVRVMMVTTECGLDEVRRALDAGADDYIMKPFTADVIAEKIGILGLAARS